MTTSAKTIEGESLSFLDLFKTETWNGIEIPLIQRDYAQGRESAHLVRKQFLKAIFTALADGGKLSLDFVYGKKSTAFIPIDGQQRLTTLFLLYWFIAYREGRSDEFKSQMTGDDNRLRFAYLVRPSSRRFFQCLMEWNPVQMGDDKEAEWFKKNIGNQKWFMRAWIQDPTVYGALKMLDAIRMEYQAQVQTGFFERLENIRMVVLSLGSDISANDIYLKLNSRGKELTGFEKFKAWLIKKHGGLQWRTAEGKDWKVLLDQDWLDFFWSYREKSDMAEGVSKDMAEGVSKAFFRTFLSLVIIARIERKETRMKGEDLNKWFKLDQVYDEVCWEEVFDAASVKSAFECLTLMSTPAPLDHPERWPAERACKRLGPDNFRGNTLGIFGPSDKISWASRAWLHVLILDLKYDNGDGAWLRIARNLIENTDVDASSFRNVVQSLSRLADCICNGSPLESLTAMGIDKNWTPGDFRSQLEEEKDKAGKILGDEGHKWKELILSSENHALLKGQIGFLLEDCDCSKFKARLKSFSLLMTGTDDESPFFVTAGLPLLRATLANCDPIRLDRQSSVKLPFERDQWAENFKRSTSTKYREKITNAFVRILDEIQIQGFTDQSAIAGWMNEQIQESKHEETWMRNIIAHGDVLLKECTERKIQKYDDDGIFVFHKSYWNKRDILIDNNSGRRNLLISRLLESGWKFKKDPDNQWMIVQRNCNTPLSPPFIKNHWIELENPDVKKSHCCFKYEKLFIPPNETGQQEIEIPYGDDGSIPPSLEKFTSKDAMPGEPAAV